MAYCKAKFLGWGDKGDLNQDRPSTSQDTNPGPVENEWTEKTIPRGTEGRKKLCPVLNLKTI